MFHAMPHCVSFSVFLFFAVKFNAGVLLKLFVFTESVYMWFVPWGCRRSAKSTYLFFQICFLSLFGTACPTDRAPDIEGFFLVYVTLHSPMLSVSDSLCAESLSDDILSLSLSESLDVAVDDFFIFPFFWFWFVLLWISSMSFCCWFMSCCCCIDCCSICSFSCAMSFALFSAVDSICSVVLLGISATLFLFVEGVSTSFVGGRFFRVGRASTICVCWPLASLLLLFERGIIWKQILKTALKGSQLTYKLRKLPCFLSCNIDPLLWNIVK